LTHYFTKKSGSKTKSPAKDSTSTKSTDIRHYFTRSTLKKTSNSPNNKTSSPKESVSTSQIANNSNARSKRKYEIEDVSDEEKAILAEVSNKRSPATKSKKKSPSSKSRKKIKTRHETDEGNNDSEIEIPTDRNGKTEKKISETRKRKRIIDSDGEEPDRAQKEKKQSPTIRKRSLILYKPDDSTKIVKEESQEMQPDQSISPQTTEEEKQADSKQKKRAWWGPKPTAKNPGSKIYPSGRENCLKGKRFVITGVMEGFSREELEDIIKTYGGTVKNGVTKTTTDYAVVGEDPGESKMKKIKEYKIKIISEDNLLEMINRTKLAETDSVPTAVESEASQQQKPTRISSPSTSTSTPVYTTVQPSPELWVDKYKPKTLQDILGNEKTINELKTWLNEWEDKYKHSKHDEEPGKGKKRIEEKRAAFISGVPGIGKTTAAKLVCEACGYEVKELNASDTRSKKTLREEIGELIDNRTISEFFAKKKNTKICIIMDEVDGMSAGDRGGIAELVKMIKQTKVPIICICNDRSKPALKTLISISLDLKFHRPRNTTIIKRLEQICAKEGVTVDYNSLELLVKSLGNDIRGLLNNLQLLATKGAAIKYQQTKNEQIEKTNRQQTIFEDVKDMLDGGKKSVDQLQEIYYNDPSLLPLFVQENYINMRPGNITEEERVKRIANAADSISMSDVINSKIYSGQHFELTPVHAYFSCIRPSYFVRGSFQSLRNYDRYFQFPACLGKQSTTNKNMGILRSIQKTSSLVTSGNNIDMLDYMPLWRIIVTQPLIEEGSAGIEDAISRLDEYNISKDDLANIIEISTFKGKLGEDPYKDVTSSTKTAFTKAYNKAHKAISKATLSKRSENRLSLEDLTGEMESADEETDEDAVIDDFIMKQKLMLNKKKFEQKQEKKASSAKAKRKKASKTS
jgi:replication factor C subunit 1